MMKNRQERLHRKQRVKEVERELYEKNIVSHDQVKS